MPTPIEQWKVKKDRQIAPHTPTYEVDPIDGEDVFTVVVIDGTPRCMADGPDCDHAKAVVAYLASKK